jgi:deoxyadenosine/deoxycytidine kinase
VYIEGNIGAGKSELLDGLSARGYTVVKEAIEEDWTLFEKAKKDPTRWVPSFQLQVTLSIAERIESALKNHWGPWPIIVERSIVSAYLFARVAGRCGNLSDTEIELIRRFSLRLNSGFDWYSTKTIMLDCPSELCLERIKERGRAGEEATSIDYLTMVEDEHINAMDSTWNHVDATKDKDTVLEAVLSMV